jgi:hypothetical protein
MSDLNVRRQHVKATRELVDRQLTFQLGIFFAVFVIMTGLVRYHLIADRIYPVWALTGVVIGVVIGRVLRRAKALNWNTSSQTVIASSSLLGTIMLVAYIIFAIFKDEIVDNWISDPAIVTVVGLALTAGVMIGRLSFMLRGLQDLLRVVRQP